MRLMRRLGTLIVAAILLVCEYMAGAAGEEWIGKVVLIKTAKETHSSVRLEGIAPRIASFESKAPEESKFKVVAGTEPDSIAFESVAQPGIFLRHQRYRLTALKGPHRDASFVVVKP